MEVLHAESRDSAGVVAALTARWAQLMDTEVPEDLQQALHLQQAECEAVLSHKGAIIEAARNILKAQDDEYVATLNAQAEVRRGRSPCTCAAHACLLMGSPGPGAGRRRAACLHGQPGGCAGQAMLRRGAAQDERVQTGVPLASTSGVCPFRAWAWNQRGGGGGRLTRPQPWE